METIRKESKGLDKETKKQQPSETEERTLVIPDCLIEVEHGEESSSHEWPGGVDKLLGAFCAGVIVACIFLLK